MNGTELPLGDYSNLVQSHYRRRHRIAYLLAVVLSLVALAIRLYLPASFGERPLLLLFLFPVIVSALLGGLGPGLLATVAVAVVTNFQLIPPYRSLAIANTYDVLQWTMLIANGALVSLFSEILLRSRQRENAHWQQLMQTRDKLWHSEILFQTIFENAAMGLAILAADGCWRKVNSKFCDIVSYDPDELIGRHFTEITCQDEQSADADLMRRLWVGELDNFTGEKRFIRKDGGIGWVSLNVSIVRRADGSPDYFVSAIEDIDQRKQAESDLFASEAALNVAQRLACLGSWAWDLRTGELKWSEQIYSVFGRDPDLPPADYDEVSRYFKPESWQRLQAAVAKACSDGTPYECEAELMDHGDLRRWVVARGEPVRDELDNILALHGTVQDITPRKQAELALLDAQRSALEAQREARLAALNLMEDALAAGEAVEMANTSLRESEEFKRAILDSVSANIAVLDREGVIVAVNLPWQQFAKENAQACGQSAVVCGIGTNYLQICRQASGPYIQDSLAVFTGLSAVLDGRLPCFRYEYACHSPQQQRWFAMVVTPLGFAGGGAVVSHTNITERKLAEIALVDSEERLRLAQSSANIGIWDWHISSDTVTWTAELEAMFGYAPGGFPGGYAAFSQRVHPEDLAELEQCRDSAVAARRTFDFDFRVQPEPGQIRWINSKGAANYDGMGLPQRVFGVCIDITERKAAEAALREQADALQRFNRAMVGREVDMIALKQRINELSFQLGQEQPYPLAFVERTVIASTLDVEP